jgi:hypothetical protein
MIKKEGTRPLFCFDLPKTGKRLKPMAGAKKVDGSTFFEEKIFCVSHPPRIVRPGRIPGKARGSRKTGGRPKSLNQ